ncbi:MAG: hypothetical protein KGN02_00800 [bacterium]|nr:hypothetical protein [bacterium]
MKRSHLLAGIGAAMLIPSTRAAALAPAPFVPLYAGVYAWDDHYFAWLPHHPIYESFEVMTIRRGPMKPLVWVFFTERAAPKHQVHFYNDADVAKGASATFAQMNVSGARFEDGVPRPIRIAGDFAGIGPLVFEVRFAKGTTFRHAGLTNQSGHNADRFVLLFYRDKACVTSQAALRIGGRAIELALDPGTLVAYSQDIEIGIIPFGTFTGKPGDTVRDAAGVHAFASTVYGHTFRCDYGSPLKPDRAHATTYAISLDGYRALTSGTVHLEPGERDIVLRYVPDMPHWARAYAFTVSVSRASGRLTIASASS